MILIITEASDTSAKSVIEWLHYFKQEYLQITTGDLVRITAIRFNTIIPSADFTVNGGGLINTDAITDYWDRKGALTLPLAYDYRKYMQAGGLQHTAPENTANEINILKGLLYFIFRTNGTKDSLIGNENNRLIRLSEAKACGLEIPDTVVCTNKNQLLDFYEQHPKGITIKPFANDFAAVNKKLPHAGFINYGSIIRREELDRVPERFPPVLVQTNVEVRLAISAFYLKGRFFAMATFPKKQQQAKINRGRPAEEPQEHSVPAELPEALKAQLELLLHRAKQRIAMIRLIYTCDKKYLFTGLEPAAEFETLSFLCNYHLEKETAIALCN